MESNSSKKCRMCQVAKPLVEFRKHKDRKDGHNGTCKACLQARRRSPLNLAKRIYNSQIRNSKKRGHPQPNYSRDEFVLWFIQHRNFKTLYKNWVASGYKKDDTPSPDRINSKLPYTFKNLRLVTWGQNRDAEQKPVIGTNVATGIKVPFKSVRQAKEYMDYKSSHSIISAIKNGTIARGFTFKYK